MSNNYRPYTTPATPRPAKISGFDTRVLATFTTFYVVPRGDDTPQAGRRMLSQAGVDWKTLDIFA